MVVYEYLYCVFDVIGDLWIKKSCFVFEEVFGYVNDYVG